MIHMHTLDPTRGRLCASDADTVACNLIGYEKAMSWHKDGHEAFMYTHYQMREESKRDTRPPQLCAFPNVVYESIT